MKRNVVLVGLEAQESDVYVIITFFHMDMVNGQTHTIKYHACHDHRSFAFPHLCISKVIATMAMQDHACVFTWVVCLFCSQMLCSVDSGRS